MNKTPNANRKTQTAKRILIVRLDRIGDVLLSTPVIKALRDAYPSSHIAFLAQPYTVDIVKGNPYLDEVIIYDKKGSQKGFFGNLKFASKLKKKNFDLALILHPNNRSHLIAFLAGIPLRVGYDKKMGFLLTKRVPHTKHLGLKHEIDNALDLLQYIGIKSKDRTLYMPINKLSDDRIAKILDKSGITEKDTVVVVHPGASCPSKKWHWKNFVKVANSLADKFSAKIIVIAGPDDKAIGDRVAASMKRCAINLSGATTVSDLASVLRRSRLLISNDSGPVHVASALGIPTIAIFSRSDRGLSPARWGPAGECDVVLHKDVGCDVCLAHNCKLGFKCLEAISVEEVLAAAEKLLRK